MMRIALSMLNLSHLLSYKLMFWRENSIGKYNSHLFIFIGMTIVSQYTRTIQDTVILCIPIKDNVAFKMAVTIL